MKHCAEANNTLQCLIRERASPELETYVRSSPTYSRHSVCLAVPYLGMLDFSGLPETFEFARLDKCDKLVERSTNSAIDLFVEFGVLCAQGKRWKVRALKPNNSNRP
jgi:hypothetical protein